MKTAVLTAAARLALARPLRDLLARASQDRTGLDPQIAAVLGIQRLLRLPALESMEPARARAFARDGLAVLDLPEVVLAHVTDRVAGGVPVRVYVPRAASADWIVYFHGGGGVIGSIDSSERFARYLAAHTRCTVASVEYRLGPEHRHPAGNDDAEAAYAALVPELRGKVAVAGDSFGGFLAAHVARAAARRPDLQVLIYPIVDMTLTSPSIARLADGYLLTRAMMQWFQQHHLPPGIDKVAISPLHWADLRGSVPAIVATAGFDPLVEEGDAYAERLRAAGVPVIHRRYPTLIHGYVSLGGGVHAARAAVDELCRDIIAALAR